MSPRARLVGDGVENPANARALAEAARMFAVPCSFRDSRGLAEQLPNLSTVDTAALLGGPGPLIAVDNMPGAESVYRSRPLHGAASIVVGNERRGIRPDVLRAAAKTVQIPMPGRHVNTLNVATAAAVALYYLLEWESLAEREQKWTAFATDPEWLEKRAGTERDGPIVSHITNTILKPTAFSKVK